jgi:hypothetical protein
MIRAGAVLRELKSTLEFVFDDAEYTRADEQLHKLAATFPRPRSHASMASALTTYSELAWEHEQALSNLPAFDLGVLDEALVLAGALRSRSGEAKVQQHFSEASERLTARNQLLALLHDRLARIRRCARLLFRDHPDIARKFTSEHKRVQRREQRRTKAAQG